jgi:hypothetical protein
VRGSNYSFINTSGRRKIADDEEKRGEGEKARRGEGEKGRKGEEEKGRRGERGECVVAPSPLLPFYMPIML